MNLIQILIETIFLNVRELRKFEHQMASWGY